MGRKSRQKQKASISPSVALVSLGCAKNLVDTEDLLGNLYYKNFRLVAEPEFADVVIVNTCGFIQASVDESQHSIQSMLDLKSKGDVQSVYAMGCYVSRGKDDIKTVFPNLDGAYALSETQSMVQHIQADFQHYSSIGKSALAGLRPISATLPHYSYLKISEGCNRTCTYCTIPDIRGGNVDKTIEELVAEATKLTERGCKELNIIAQDTTSYGIEKYGQPKLKSLLEELEKISELKWIRLLYAYPDYIDDELSDFLIESPKMVNYLELPIQHASASVLKKMNRPGTFPIYDRLFDKLRSKRSDYALRTTVILGFPGETDEDFQYLYDYCKSRKFDRLGAFKYYREEGTPAYKMKNQVPTEVVDERYDQLMQLQQELHFEQNEQVIGKDIEFICDEVDESGTEVVGRTFRDAIDIDSQIYIKSSIPLEPGVISTCRVTGKRDYDLEGVL